MKVIAVLCLLFGLVTAAPVNAAPPAVDGFLGVPWGAGRVQVAAAMSKMGFPLLQQRDDGSVDSYQGTFAGHPAQINFYYVDNVFYEGWAGFTDSKATWGGFNNPDTRSQLVMLKLEYLELLRVFTAKYGNYDIAGTATNPNNSNEIVYEKTSWEHVPTTATPASNVTIAVSYGTTGGFGIGYRQPMSIGVSVRYSIGDAWARLKSDRNGI